MSVTKRLEAVFCQYVELPTTHDGRTRPPTPVTKPKKQVSVPQFEGTHSCEEEWEAV